LARDPCPVTEESTNAKPAKLASAPAEADDVAGLFAGACRDLSAAVCGAGAELQAQTISTRAQFAARTGAMRIKDFRSAGKKEC